MAAVVAPTVVAPKVVEPSAAEPAPPLNAGVWLVGIPALAALALTGLAATPAGQGLCLACAGAGGAWVFFAGRATAAPAPAADDEDAPRKVWSFSADVTRRDLAWSAVMFAIAFFFRAAHGDLAFCAAVTTAVVTLGTPFSIYFEKRHQPHRLLGLSYLVQWTLAFYLYFRDYATFRDGPILLSLPLTGFAQAVIATRTFWFLPKKQKDPGYYSDKSTLTYNFVAENQFFSGILLWQCVYMDARARPVLATTYWGNVVEALLVFLPYVALRPFTPKTSFRDSLRGGDGKKGNKSKRNETFFYVETWITKVFYVFAKHFIGYFLNYARFLNRLGPDEVYHIHLMLVFSCFATTISMFLHTLKFRGYMGPRTSFLTYQASYLATLYSWYKLAPTLTGNGDLVLVTLAGVWVNFQGQNAIRAYQAAVLAGLFYLRATGSA